LDKNYLHWLDGKAFLVVVTLSGVS
jgi:hypothetical protein